ncbi:MAG: YjbQ family protein [Acidobacteria bacterium ACB2]|nr:YjbQ family protein [Acidobacteria bacterium ACB2]
MVVTDRIRLETRGEGEVRDVTGAVQEVVTRHGFTEGSALVFVPGSTAAVTTIEYEDGLLDDFPALFERIAPRGIRYGHEERWHDGNGHSHVRASLLGPSLAVPFSAGRLLLGTWQQVVLVDFDNRPRRRELVVQLSGEGREGPGA